MGEFDLIDRLFRRPAAARAARPGVLLGIGDDCALIDAGPLAISTDMLVEGRHFFPDADPAALGHKALAVNLSDLAAMGAEPLGFTLALALPPERAGDLQWCEAFAAGMFALADAQACALIGGDTTAGPLTISITVFGRVDPARALRRSGACAGDDIWISGVIGDAALALARRFAAREVGVALAPNGVISNAPRADSSPSGRAAPPNDAAGQRLDRPTPRVALGRALLGIASSAIDLSDGLAGDLMHVLDASTVDARIDLDRLPLSPELLAVAEPQRWKYALAGGDDYELCFTASAARRADVLAAAHASSTAVTRVGNITVPAANRGTTIAPDTAGRARIVWLRDGQPHPLALHGFDHFAAPSAA